MKTANAFYFYLFAPLGRKLPWYAIELVQWDIRWLGYKSGCFVECLSQFEYFKQQTWARCWSGCRLWLHVFCSVHDSVEDSMERSLVAELETGFTGCTFYRYRSRSGSHLSVAIASFAQANHCRGIRYGSGSIAIEIAPCDTGCRPCRQHAGPDQ